jgi:ankyrin repeat protein
MSQPEKSCTCIKSKNLLKKNYSNTHEPPVIQEHFSDSFNEGKGCILCKEKRIPTQNEINWAIDFFRKTLDLPQADIFNLGDIRNDVGDNFFHLAFKCGDSSPPRFIQQIILHIQPFEYLLHVENDKEVSPFLQICSHHDCYAIKLFLEHGAAVKKNKNPSWTCENLIARDGCVECMKLLLGHQNFSVNSQVLKWTPLLMAVKNNKEEMVKFLLSQGADPNAIGPDGFTPILLSASLTGGNICQALIEKQAFVNCSTEKGECPLLIAVVSGNSEFIKKILELKDNHYRSTEDGKKEFSNSLVVAKIQVDHCPEEKKQKFTECLNIMNAF